MYDALNQDVLHAVPASARSVLDVGCGTGTLGSELRRTLGASVTGVSGSPHEVARAAAVLDSALQANLDEWDGEGVAHPFDVIVCSHVLEHLREPKRLLQVLARRSQTRTLLLVALPNVLHWRQRVHFLRGRFRYAEGGIMDRTHLRFFDWSAAHELVGSAGWRVTRSWATGHAPGVWRTPKVGPLLDRWCARVAPGFFGDQFVLAAVPAAR